MRGAVVLAVDDSDHIARHARTLADVAHEEWCAKRPVDVETANVTAVPDDLARRTGRPGTAVGRGSAAVSGSAGTVAQ
ncbi:hypothetical protein Pen02_03260 [Plantactinospora endophytica]|uniref:UspA domain-containing protein n=1 Tax=Plantactinospora endophytica TaxID=673535 RepID=A0ABQ4DSE9_9ACTN|nr:hypothetical protein Pen02_03260 [Plantactinospora endophytica]